jgi:chromate transporter
LNLSEREGHETIVALTTVAKEWGRIGCLGFGGPPSHIVMLRELCVDKRRWLTGADFEDAVVACNLLPGPASTQLAIYCASRVRSRAGAVVGGLAFIVPGLAMVLVLSALFSRTHHRHGFRGPVPAPARPLRPSQPAPRSS